MFGHLKKENLVITKWNSETNLSCLLLSYKTFFDAGFVTTCKRRIVITSESLLVCRPLIFLLVRFFVGSRNHNGVSTCHVWAIECYLLTYQWGGGGGGG